MPYVTYIEADGTAHTVDVLNGDSIMQGATANGIEGIVAECGGSCSCATCHCYVDDAWADKEKQADRHASQKNRKTNLPTCLQQALTHDHLPSANLTLLQLLISGPHKAAKWQGEPYNIFQK